MQVNTKIIMQYNIDKFGMVNKFNAIHPPAMGRWKTISSGLNSLTVILFSDARNFFA